MKNYIELSICIFILICPFFAQLKELSAAIITKDPGATFQTMTIDGVMKENHQ